MSREELLNTAEYWQEMAENECWREGIDCKIQLIDGNKQLHKVVSYPCNSLWDKNKVCAVLKRMISEITYVDLQENTTEHYDKTEFIEDFCKVMEGM